jgi:ribosomal protein S18 acetylase RimI-like enzyme
MKSKYIFLLLASVVHAFGPASITSISSKKTSPAATTTRIPMTTKETNDIIKNDDDTDDGQLDLNLLNFRSATSDDIPRCFDIESSSYPSDEAATLESLTNRHKYAGEYFVLCTITSTTITKGSESEESQEQEQKEKEKETILGFICGTRCNEFTEESMSEHNKDGRLLAVHSVVIDEQYRRKGIASKMMKRYVRDIIVQEEEEEVLHKQLSSPPPIESIVFIAKQNLLGFYVRCGFKVNGPSQIVHGKELWYDLEMDLLPIITETKIKTVPRTHPYSDESWFCKTETFIRPFPEVKPYLEEHKKWVENIRQTQDICIVSGYRVDEQGKPGGGGLMFVAAKSYKEAFELVSNNDPLIVNECVDWELNGWIGQVGDISIR